MKTGLYILCLLIAMPALAQSKKDRIRADYYYRQNAYYKAIPHYEALTKEEQPATADLEHLGNCYRMVGDAANAIVYYTRATAAEDCQPDTWLHLAQAQLRLGDYAKAQAAIDKYATYKPEDARIGIIAGSCHIGIERSRDTLPGGVLFYAPFNSDGNEFAPTIWHKQLVYTADTAMDINKNTDAWSGANYCGLYTVPCSGPAAWSTEVQPLDANKMLSIRYHTGPVGFGPSNTAYFTRTRYEHRLLQGKAVANADSVVTLEIISAQYDSSKKSFEKLTTFAYSRKAYSTGHATVTPDGTLLAFMSEQPGGFGGRDIYICKKQGNGWGTPINAGAQINTVGEESFPYWADNNTLFFSSDGHAGMGGLDIYRSRYVSDSFTTPVDLPGPLNSSYDETSMGMDASGTSGYFSSNRPAINGGDNIYYYKKAERFVRLVVRDSITGAPIPGLIITVRNGKDSTILTTDQNGEYDLRMLPQTTYHFVAENDYYRPTAATLRTNINPGGPETDTTVQELKMIPWRIPKDTIAAITTTVTPAKIRKGIMDPQGITEFEVDQVYVIGHFDFNFSKFYYKSDNKDVDVDKRVVLDTLTAILRRHPTMRIKIQAHTDCRGSDEYNMKLSIARATSVVTYLQKKGISAKRLEYEGYGERMPVIPCPDCESCTEEEHSQNRVLEFKVLEL